MKDTNKLVKNILRALPAIPFLVPRRRRSIAPILLGAVGVAIAGGVVALMFFSPRTRHRALGAAKGGYGKVRGQLDQFAWADKLGISRRANAHSGSEGGANYQSSGI